MTSAPPDVERAASRGRVVVWLLVAGIVADALNIAVTGIEVATLERYQRGLASLAEANAAIDRSGAVAILLLLVLIATVIAWLRWQHRSQANLHAARVLDLGFTPGWAVGWWFVPIASLWKPFQAVNELHKASRGDRAWQLARTWPVIGWWWAGYLTFNVLDGIAGRLFADETGSVEPFLTGDRISIVADLMSIATALLAIRIVRAVVERQEHLRPAAPSFGPPPIPPPPVPPPPAVPPAP